MDPRRSEITATYSQFVITVYLLLRGYIHYSVIIIIHFLRAAAGRGPWMIACMRLRPLSGYPNPRLVLYLLPQAAVGH